MQILCPNIYPWKRGTVMPMTEVKAENLHLEQLQRRAESEVLCGWYSMLHAALRDQRVRKLAEPEFRVNWLVDAYVASIPVLEYLRSTGVQTDRYSDREQLADYMRELLADQLAEYGLELRVIEVHCDMEGAVRVYALKPGQEPIFI